LPTEDSLAVIVSAKTKAHTDLPERYGLFFTARVLGQPAVTTSQPTIMPGDTQLPSPTDISAVITPVNTPEAQITPTPDLSFNSPSESPTSSSNSFLSAGVGVFLSALIIIAAVVVGVWRVRSNR
jgi:hypothetical protein